MDSMNVIAPNLNGLVYRNHVPFKNKIYNFLDVVDINKDGGMIVGSNNLNGRYWDGAMCFLQNYSTEFLLENITSSINLECGITDAKFLNADKKVLVSYDSGDLNVLDVNDGKLLLLEKYNNKSHENRVTELSIWKNLNSFLSSSADLSIKLWEINDSNLSLIHDYEEAHSKIVSSVDANSNDAQIFVSCSYDHTALMWDKRTTDKKVIYENEFSALTKIQWHPSKSHILVVGTSGGDIYTVDTREPNKFISKNSCYFRSIHNIAFNSEGLLAVCADDTTLKVFDTANEDLKLLYVDDKHNDFIRGLAWHNSTLISCGYDTQVCIHNL